MNIPYDEMPEKIEELMAEVERLESENKHLLDLQKNMDQQYEELETNWKELKKYIEKIIVDSKAGSGQQYYYQQVYKFMQEIESGKNE